MNHTAEIEADIERLSRDLLNMGLASGDAVFVHAAYKSLGHVEGGAFTVVAALERVVGPSGHVVMPVFNLIPGGYDARQAAWDLETSPSTTGWLTEFFRRIPGTARSDHYSHSVAARGPDAAWLVAGHRDMIGNPSPWDRPPHGLTYGDHSPFMRLYGMPQAKCLMLGADHRSTTFCHLAEVLYWAQQRRHHPDAPYTWIHRVKVGDWYDATGATTFGHVGSAPTRLFGIRHYVDSIVPLVRSDPAAWSPWVHC